jgi:hypothetical protein
MTIEFRLIDLENMLKNTFHNVLWEYENASLSELSYIINSNLTHNEAIEKLKNVRELYFGKMLGVDYMFYRMLDKETKNIFYERQEQLRASFSRDLNTIYAKHSIRLDNIYKNN